MPHHDIGLTRVKIVERCGNSEHWPNPVYNPEAVCNCAGMLDLRVGGISGLVKLGDPQAIAELRRCGIDTVVMLGRDIAWLDDNTPAYRRRPEGQ